MPKILLDIGADEYNGLYCYETVLQSVSNYYKTDVWIAFCKSLAFHYKYDAGKDLSRMITSGAPHRDMEEMLLKYGNISTGSFEAGDSLRASGWETDRFRELLTAGTPIYTAFRNKYINDYTSKEPDDYVNPCIVIGFDTKKDIYHIIPIHIGRKVKSIGRANAMKELSYYKTYTRLGGGVNLLSKESVYSDINTISANDTFAQMRACAADMRRLKLISENPSDAGISDFAYAIDSLRNLRWDFLRALKYIFDALGIQHFSILEEMENAATGWAVISGIMIKASITGVYRGINEKVADMLTSLSEHEEKVVNNVLLCLGDKYSESGKTGAEISEYEILGITRHMNNNSFCLRENAGTGGGVGADGAGCASGGSGAGDGGGADFTGGGVCLLSDNLPDNGVVNVGKYKFELKNLKVNGCDNISCSGQRIPVGGTAAGVRTGMSPTSELLFLACSENGSFEAAVDLVYTDGHKSTEKFYVSNCCILPGNLDYAVKTEGLVKSENRLLPDLYLKFYSIKADIGKTLKEIVLPACKNIHIYAINACR